MNKIKVCFILYICKAMYFFNHFCPIFWLDFMLSCLCGTCGDLGKRINWLVSIWDVGMRAALSQTAILGTNEYSGVSSSLTLLN